MQGAEHGFVRYYADPLSSAWMSGCDAGYALHSNTFHTVTYHCIALCCSVLYLAPLCFFMFLWSSGSWFSQTTRWKSKQQVKLHTSRSHERRGDTASFGRAVWGRSRNQFLSATSSLENHLKGIVCPVSNLYIARQNEAGPKQNIVIVLWTLCVYPCLSLFKRSCWLEGRPTDQFHRKPRHMSRN